MLTLPGASNTGIPVTSPSEGPNLFSARYPGRSVPLPFSWSGFQNAADLGNQAGLLPGSDLLYVWNNASQGVTLYAPDPQVAQQFATFLASPPPLEVNQYGILPAYAKQVGTSNINTIASYYPTAFRQFEQGWKPVGTLGPGGVVTAPDGSSVTLPSTDVDFLRSDITSCAGNACPSGSSGMFGGAARFSSGTSSSAFRDVITGLGLAIPTVGAGLALTPAIIPTVAAAGIPASAVPVVAAGIAGAGLNAATQAGLTGKVDPTSVAISGVAPVAGSGLASLGIPPVLAAGTIGAGGTALAQLGRTGSIDPAGVAAAGAGSVVGNLAGSAIGGALQPTTPISTPTPLASLPPPPGLSGTPSSTVLSPTPSTPGINPGVPDLNLGIFGGVPTPTPLTTSFINPGVAGINPGIFGTAPSTGVNMPFNFNLDFNNLFGPSTSPINPNVPDLNPGIFGTTPTPPPTTSLVNPGVPDLNLGIFGGGGGAQAATGAGSGISDTALNFLKSFGSSAAGTLANIGTRLLFGRPGTGGTPGSVGSTPGLLENILTGGLGIAGTNALGNFLGLNRTQQPQQTYSTSGQAGFAQFPDLQSQLASLGLGATQAATGAITGNLNAPINFPGLQDNGLFPQQQPSANQLLGPFVNQLNAPINFPQLQNNGLFPQQQAGVDQLSRQMLNMASSDAASRGMLSPQNTSAVAGSALQNMLPALLPMISQNIQEAAMTPEQITQARLGQFGNVASMFPGLAGQNVLTAANLPEQIRQQRIAQLLSYMASTQGALGERRAAVGQGNFESFLAAINQGFGRSAGSALGAGGGKGLV